MTDELTPEVARDVRFQSYEPPPEIHGVHLVPLRKLRSLEGWFMEVLRLEEGRAEGLPEGFRLEQVSVARAAPGRINAFHLHPRRRQDEAWAVLDGELRVWLVDVRRDSPTTGARRRVHLSAEEPALLLVPSGVAHGWQAGRRGALVLYLASARFDPADPDEGRLPWDYFGAELWEEDRG